MLVYGDIERIEDPASVRASIARDLHAYMRQPPGRDRHATLVGAFIRVSELVQGLADAEFDTRGVDDVSPVQDSGAQLLWELAGMIARSWSTGFFEAVPLPADWPHLLDELQGAEPVRIRMAEGYTYYALYPESYLEAARRSRLGANTVVIGLRSIGTGLGAAVAASIGANPAISLRPIGHPFDRKVRISAALSEKILGRPDADFAIVDDGPGLSGSSMGGIADWLEARGIRRNRLHFFPGHSGDLGREACLRHRQRWAERGRHVVGVDDLLMTPFNGVQRLHNWVSDLVGVLNHPLQLLSGGEWRKLRYPDETVWPPSDKQTEKHKFLARSGDKAWLVKFAGLGREGVRKLEEGKLLAKAGYTPKPVGLCHGFLVEQWVDGRPLNPVSIDRRQLIRSIGDYLGFRARCLPATHGGASPEQLFFMAVFNTGKALGEDAAVLLEKYLGDAEPFSPLMHPVDTDNRLHAWEWIVTPAGALIKTDALDHSAAHDLIGCQDIAWDIAGAGVEVDLSGQERLELARMVSQIAGREVDRELLRVLEPCYVAFQIGYWTFAAAAATGSDAHRINGILERYKRRLRSLLEAASAQC